MAATATTSSTSINERELYVKPVALFGRLDFDKDKPIISIRFLVQQSYKSPDGAIRTETGFDAPGKDIIGDISSSHPYDSITYDLLSTMISGLNIPFPLENMQWEAVNFPIPSLCPQSSELENVDELIHLVLDMSRATKFTKFYNNNHGPNLVALDFYIENIVILPGHEIQAIDRAKKKQDRVRRLQHSVSSRVQLGWSAEFSNIAYTIRDSVCRTAPTDKAVWDSKYERELELSLLEQGMREYFQKVETMKFQGQAEGEGDDKEDEILCHICKNEILIGSRIARMPCSHIFHVRCIADWLQTNSLTCPLCRFNLSTNYTHHHPGKKAKLLSPKEKEAHVSKW